MSAPVSGPIAIGALDLAALLCSRVCHDLISPVGRHRQRHRSDGGGQGRGNQDFCARSDQEERVSGIGQTAILPARLRRGGLGRRPDRSWRCGKGGARDFSRTIRPNWSGTCRANCWQRTASSCLLNMLLIAAGTIPRGGTLTVDPASGAGEGNRLCGHGFRPQCQLSPVTAELLAGSPAQTVDAHGIQPLYAGILARDCGLVLSARLRGRSGCINGPLTVRPATEKCTFDGVGTLPATEIKRFRNTLTQSDQAFRVRAATARVLRAYGGGAAAPAVESACADEAPHGRPASGVPDRDQ